MHCHTETLCIRALHELSPVGSVKGNRPGPCSGAALARQKPQARTDPKSERETQSGKGPSGDRWPSRVAILARLVLSGQETRRGNPGTIVGWGALRATVLDSEPLTEILKHRVYPKS
jgi:hypothetical protein